MTSLDQNWSEACSTLCCLCPLLFDFTSSRMRDGSLEGSLKDSISTAGIPCKVSFNEFPLLFDRLLTLLPFILSSTKWSRAGTMREKKVTGFKLRSTGSSRRKCRSALIIKLIVNFYTGDHLDASWFFGDSSCAAWTEWRWEKERRENVLAAKGGNKCPHVLDIVPLSHLN